jgi:ATP-dependent DNA ligase
MAVKASSPAEANRSKNAQQVRLAWLSELIPGAAVLNDPFVHMPNPEPFLFEPMLCASIERPPEDREWRYELKLDGFRAIGRKSGRSAQLWSRNQKDFTRRGRP